MNWWHYLLLANLYLALFYGFYLLLLRKETYFMLNRIYLVSAAVLSFFIPLMQAEWVKNLFITQKVQQTIYYIDPGFVYQISGKAENGFTIAQVFTTVYWLVSMLLLARLIYRFVQLKGYLQTVKNGAAFSFFGKVQVDENLPQKEIIMQHELVHVAQLHSADVLLFEALTILNWFNPVIYFYRKAIKYNHEFIADQNAISFGVDKSDYAMLLLSESLGVQSNHLVNSFFNQSLLKQRILMLHKNPSRRSALLKYGLSAPLFAAMLILTSATVSEQKTILNLSEKINSDVTVSEAAKDVITSINITAPEKSAVKEVSVLKGKLAPTLKGKVVNINGEPIAGVKITYGKKNNSITTDQNGDFKISSYTEDDLLIFEFVGFNSIAKSFNNVKGKIPVVVLQERKMAGTGSLTVLSGDVVKFTDVDRLPAFPGSETGLGNYLAKSIRYPKEARSQEIVGRVIVSFIVEKDGKLNDIKVLRDIGGGCGPEALRVLSESPRWSPGLKDGQPVRVSYTMPINFTLADGKKAYSPDNIGVNQDSSKQIVNFINIIRTGNNLDTTKTYRTTSAGDLTLAQPLYFIDGKEGKKGDIDKISPNDIESISVLKGNSAITKYGEKGKNGVVEITMKKAKKP